MKSRLLAAAGASLILFTAACGGDDSSADTTTAPAATTAGEAGAFNEADVTFAQGMIAHHEQAIEMAEIALDPTVGARAEVTELATRIRDAQGTEIDQMTSWLDAWGRPTTMDTSGGHDMESMDGMMSAEDMDRLGTLTGSEFDTAWLQMMIEHHEGAIAQSEDAKADGTNPDVAVLADAIIAAQSAEIDTMQGLLGG
jgi:uncharacterized protein (DUF305 family)